MAGRNTLRVTVVWSPAARTTVEIDVCVPVNSTVHDVLSICSASHTLWLDHQPWQVGIWGKKVQTGTEVHAGDRVEIYRPLTVDPKVARRERFAKQGSRKVPGLFARRRPGAKPGY